MASEIHTYSYAGVQTTNGEKYAKEAEFHQKNGKVTGMVKVSTRGDKKVYKIEGNIGTGLQVQELAKAKAKVKNQKEVHGKKK